MAYRRRLISFYLFFISFPLYLLPPVPLSPLACSFFFNGLFFFLLLQRLNLCFTPYFSASLSALSLPPSDSFLPVFLFPPSEDGLHTE